MYKQPASDMKVVDFGSKIGQREVVRLNLIECESCHTSTGIQNVSTFFGTGTSHHYHNTIIIIIIILSLLLAPSLWNRLFIYMARLIPQKVLQNRDAMKLLAIISLPMVRLVDYFVKSRNCIRVELKLKDKKKVIGILAHEDLEQAVGVSLAAFALAFSSSSSISPGVYFPEEIKILSFRDDILKYIINNGNGNGVIEYIVKEEESV